MSTVPPLEAMFFQGNALMADHTPGAAVAAGQVIVSAGEVWIAHLDIAANQLGAVAVPSGSAIYQCIADGAITPGAAVNWDNTAKKVTVGAGDAKFGVAVSAAAADGDKVLVRHDPT